MNKLNITSYNQIDSISLFIKTSTGIQEVEFKGNNGINTFRNIFNNLEAKTNGSGNLSVPKKIVIDDRIETPKSTKRPIKKQQLPEIDDIGIENIDEVEDFEVQAAPDNFLARSNVMNLSYAPTSGEMTPAQMAKLMASQSGFSFQK